MLLLLARNATLGPFPILTASHPINSVASDSATHTTPPFTPKTGEVLVLKGVSENSTVTMGTPTATGGTITWTKQVENVAANNCYGVIWTGTVTAGGSPITVSMPAGGVAGWRSLVLERWSNAQLAGTPATGSNRSTGAPSATITTAANNSVVSWSNGDWAAISPATKAYRSSAIQDGLHDKSPGSYTGYLAYQQAPTAGSQTYGLTLPAGQTFDLLAVEVQGASGGIPTTTGTLPINAQLTGSPVTVASSSGTTPATVGMSGAAVTVAITTGVLAISLGLTGTATPVTGVTTTGQLPTSIGLTGTATTVATTTGTLPITVGASGTAVTVGSSSGQLALAIGLAGAPKTVAQTAGMLPTNLGMTGTAQTVAVTAGTLPIVVSLTGTTTAVQATTGQLGTSVGLQGVAVTIAQTTGTLPIAVNLTGTASPVVVTVGTLGIGVSYVGTIGVDLTDITVTGTLEPRRWDGTHTPKTRTGQLTETTRAGTLNQTARTGTIDRRWKGTL